MLIASTDGNVYSVAVNANGQGFGAAIVASTPGAVAAPRAMAAIKKPIGLRYFLALAGAGTVVELSAAGAVMPIPGIGPGAIPAATGLATYPVPMGVNWPAFRGHLFVAGAGGIYDLNPGGAGTSFIPGVSSAPGTAVLRINVPGNLDGIAFALNGTVLYAVIRGGTDLAASNVTAYSTGIPPGFPAFGTPIYTTGNIFTGADGIATGIGGLAGYMYVNCNGGAGGIGTGGGTLVEYALPPLNGNPGAPLPGTFNTIVTNVALNRGDFVIDDPFWTPPPNTPFPSLVFSQSSSFWRLDAPGGFFSSMFPDTVGGAVAVVPGVSPFASAGLIVCLLLMGVIAVGVHATRAREA